MLAALLIAFREGLEAALIVGIALSVLRRLGRSDRGASIWAGVVAAVIVSVLAWTVAVTVAPARNKSVGGSRSPGACAVVAPRPSSSCAFVA